MTSWHFITSEYPPQPGGVSDYTHQVAAGLAAEGDEVHVWCPPADGPTPQSAGVVVHRELNQLTLPDLRRAGKMLSEFSSPRRLLVQWVPHGYGYQSMNLPFCFWLYERAKIHKDLVEVMVHEPYLTFRGGSWKQSAVALVHRLMTITILNAAYKVWLSIPAWEACLRPYTLGRRVPFNWLPIPSTVPFAEDYAGARVVRERYARNGNILIGHLGTGERNINALLIDAIPLLWQTHCEFDLLLLGRRSESLRDEIVRKHSGIAAHIHATGGLSPENLSRHISACDLMFQPYPDGVSSRRTSTMVGLSHGLPVVTTTGSLTEPLWAESNAGALTPVEDHTAFAETLHRLLSDKDARSRMSVSAKKLYQDRFDVKHTISALRQAPR